MRKTRSSSIAGLSALLLLLGMITAAPAFAAPSCTIDPDGVTMNVTVDGAGAKIVRGTAGVTPDTILVSPPVGAAAPCAGAPADEQTVFDINTINVPGTDALTIDLSGGDFAPGFSTETGTDEIEFYLGSGITLTIQGTTSADNWSFGQSATTTDPKGVGLNSDSDPDILSGTPTSPAALSVASVTAKGGAGNDTFEQTFNAAEKLDGGDGTDTVDYSARTAALTVTVGNAVADDGEATEADNIGADIESVIGGSGADSISVLPTTSTTKYKLDGGAGNDTLLKGAAGRDTILGGAGDDTLNGGGARDLLNGGAGVDIENGEGGSDVFDQERLSNGGDTLNGGADSDAVKYSLRLTGVRVTVGDAVSDGACTAPCAAATEGDNVGGDIELVYGGKTNDVLIAKDGANYRLSGGAGDDKLTGANKNDRLIGGAGKDTAIGGAGDDYLSGGSENDILVGGDDDDNLAGGSGDDRMNGEAGGDRVSGSSGEDELWGDGASTPKVKDTLVGGSQPTGESDKCERDLKDQKSGCEAKTSGTAPSTGNV